MKLMEEKSGSVYNTTVVKKKPGPIQLRPLGSSPDSWARQWANYYV